MVALQLFAASQTDLPPNFDICMVAWLGRDSFLYLLGLRDFVDEFAHLLARLFRSGVLLVGYDDDYI